MSEVTTNVYEGMFLFPTSKSARLSEAIGHVKEMLDRAGAEMIAMSKWNEGQLSYAIKKHRRGLYLLTYFNCDPQKMVQIERDSNLSEEIMRYMIIRADHLTVEEIRAMDGQEALATEIKLRDEEEAAQEIKATESDADAGEPEAEVTDEVMEEAPADVAIEPTEPEQEEVAAVAVEEPSEPRPAE